MLTKISSKMLSKFEEHGLFLILNKKRGCLLVGRIEDDKLLVSFESDYETGNFHLSSDHTKSNKDEIAKNKSNAPVITKHDELVKLIPFVNGV